MGGKRSPRGRRRPSTRSATAGSATSTPSSSRSCCSASAACSRSTRAATRCSTREPIDAWQWVPIAVLLVAIGLESFSFRTAIHESQPDPRATVLGAVHPAGQGARAAGRPARGLRRADRPGLRPHRRRDDAAHRQRHLGRPRHRWPSACCSSASRSCWRSRPRACCSARAPTPRRSARIQAALLADDSVQRVIHMRTLHLGPEELLVAAKIAVAPHRQRRRGGPRHRRGRGAGPRGRADGPGDLPGAGHLRRAGGRHDVGSHSRVLTCRRAHRRSGGLEQAADRDLQPAAPGGGRLPGSGGGRLA